MPHCGLVPFIILFFSRVVEWLDEYHPGSFRQAQVSFSTRIPSAFPLGDAATMSTNVCLYRYSKLFISPGFINAIDYNNSDLIGSVKWLHTHNLKMNFFKSHSSFVVGFHYFCFRTTESRNYFFFSYEHIFWAALHDCLVFTALLFQVFSLHFFLDLFYLFVKFQIKPLLETLLIVLCCVLLIILTLYMAMTFQSSKIS